MIALTVTGRSNSNRDVPRTTNHSTVATPEFASAVAHIRYFERYLALAREAATGGDRVAAENFYQHAEHYFRVNNAGDRYSPETSRQVDPAPIKTGIATTELNELELEREQPRMNANQPGL